MPVRQMYFGPAAQRSKVTMDRIKREREEEMQRLALVVKDTSDPKAAAIAATRLARMKGGGGGNGKGAGGTGKGKGGRAKGKGGGAPKAAAVAGWTEMRCGLTAEEACRGLKFRTAFGCPKVRKVCSEDSSCVGIRRDVDGSCQMLTCGRVRRGQSCISMRKFVTWKDCGGFVEQRLSLISGLLIAWLTDRVALVPPRLYTQQMASTFGGRSEFVGQAPGLPVDHLYDVLATRDALGALGIHARVAPNYGSATTLRVQNDDPSVVQVTNRQLNASFFARGLAGRSAALLKLSCPLNAVKIRRQHPQGRKLHDLFWQVEHALVFANWIRRAAEDRLRGLSTRYGGPDERWGKTDLRRHRRPAVLRVPPGTVDCGHSSLHQLTRGCPGGPIDVVLGGSRNASLPSVHVVFDLRKGQSTALKIMQSIAAAVEPVRGAEVRESDPLWKESHEVATAIEYNISKWSSLYIGDARTNFSALVLLAGDPRIWTSEDLRACRRRGRLSAAPGECADVTSREPITRFYYNRAPKLRRGVSRPVPLANLIGFTGRGPREARSYQRTNQTLLPWESAAAQIRCCPGAEHENIQEQLEANFQRRPT